MSSERRQGMGQIGRGRAQLDPIWRENRDVRSRLWPKPWMAKAKGTSARAVGQAGKQKAPDVSRANKWGRRPLVTLGLSKVTRPGPKGGRNPVEASSLASCTARPCHHTTAPAANTIPRNGRLRLTANRPYDGNEMSHKDSSPALPFAGEGAKVSAPARSAAEHRPTVMTGGYQSKGGVAAPIGPKTPPSP
ncbi:hypothetical protein D3C78_407640 [compost metagenome]